MNLINLNKVSKNFGYGDLFRNVSFSLNEGDVLSIVGPNGCGKSTLLKIIMGEEKCEEGTISIKKRAKISYLQQKVNENDDRKCIDYLKDAFSEINELSNLITKYEQVIMDTESKEYTKNLEKYCNLIERYTNAGGYEISTRIKEVCAGLNISEELLEQPFSSLSGGEKTLVNLAKCLLEKPDIFVLDEPTNHLDIEKIEWLENYIKGFKGGIIMVSHDRYFLDILSNKILDLSDIDAELYNLSYTTFLEEKQKRFERQIADYKVQQQQIKKLEQEVSYFIQKANQTKSSAMFDRAKQLKEKIQKIKEFGVSKPIIQREIKDSINEVNKRSKIVFDVENLSVYKPDDTRILKDLDISIKYGERIALIGGNGSGKSTFINTILGKNQLRYDGTITMGPSTELAYLPQIITFENPKLKVLDYFLKEVAIDSEKARGLLSKYQFYQDTVNKRVGDLSEGEKIRLRLAVLFQKNINCLIFDEPTNHIDISTKEFLEKILNEFYGTLIFASHDRYFINKFADKVLEFKNGITNLYLGNYDYYKEKQSESIYSKKQKK